MLEYQKFCILIISIIFLNVIIHIVIWHSVFVDKNKPLDNDRFQDYLIHNSKCKIPDYESYDRNTLSYIERKEYVPCRYTNETFTRITRKNGKAFVVVERSLSHNKNWFSCCYCNVTPDASTRPDYEIEVSACEFFKDMVQVINDVIYVKCYLDDVVVYENIHAITFIDKTISYDLFDNGSISKSPNVIILGLSSVAKMDFYKVFPRTYRFLKEQQWLEYTALNVIGDRTNVNLIAMLTGNFNVSSDSSDSFVTDEDFIWREFKKRGYVTAYVKDSIDNGVLQYSKLGFQYPPTDFYFRHYVIATDMLLKRHMFDCVYCTGPETTVERILNIAEDFLTRTRRQKSFSLFWMDGFARKNTHALEGLDEKLKSFFRSLTRNGILHNSMVLFLSDGGNNWPRAGTLKAWYARKLPFLYMWIPPTLQQRHPEKYKTIFENRNVLITPYDLYLTIQDILVTYFDKHDFRKSRSCSECFSLFTKHSNLRSCEEASIGSEWCTCLGYEKLQNHDSTLAKLAEEFIIRKAKHEIDRKSNDSYICNEIKSKKMKHIWMSDIRSASNREDVYNSYLKISMDTNLGIVLNGTLLVNYENGTTTFEMVKLGGLEEWSQPSWKSKYCLTRMVLSYFSSPHWYSYF